MRPSYSWISVSDVEPYGTAGQADRLVLVELVLRKGCVIQSDSVATVSFRWFLRSLHSVLICIDSERSFLFLSHPALTKCWPNGGRLANL